MDADLVELSQTLGSACLQHRLLIATAESCTGGWVAQVVTAIAGSSAWFDGGFVTYSNEAKQRLLGVPSITLARHGAVSEATTAAMVRGTLERCGTELALSISGIAGPGGGSPTKPVGTVCFGWGKAGEAPRTATCHFKGDRESVRRQAVIHALETLLAHYP